METSCNKSMFWKRAFLAEVLGGERMLYLKTQKVNTTQTNKTAHLQQMTLCPGCAADRCGGMADGRAILLAWMRAFAGEHMFGKATCQNRHRMTTDWSLKCSQIFRMWVRVIWQEEILTVGREEGRDKCQQERKAQLDQQALPSNRKTVQFNIPKAFIPINYNSTHLLTLLAARLRHSSTLGSLKVADW